MVSQQLVGGGERKKKGSLFLKNSVIFLSQIYQPSLGGPKLWDIFRTLLLVFSLSLVATLEPSPQRTTSFPAFASSAPSSSVENLWGCDLGWRELNRPLRCTLVESQK